MSYIITYNETVLISDKEIHLEDNNGELFKWPDFDDDYARALEIEKYDDALRIFEKVASVISLYKPENETGELKLIEINSILYKQL